MSEPTSSFRVGTTPVAVVGAACRLPGAPNEHEFWKVLSDGRCTVGPLPEGRWRPEKYLHPRQTEPGFSYTFNGGYLAEPFGFDPTVFGISPREARQIDPQQRLLLEVVWEALEDAGVPPSSLTGSEVGVYVGASSLDYGNLHMTDPASIESHFMTGNTLSIVSNRISNAIDRRGPSFTGDTACSSSMVAFSEAMSAIETGRVEIAVVAGVNMLLSPGSFIGFSRASMLSPTGLCRPFSAAGDGYVRAEGAVAFLIMRADVARRRNLAPRAMVLAAGVNSDGRTSGISLPSAHGQRALLDRLYGHAGIDPAKLAFVEAHGTGTRVGDPAEAQAIGEALGQKRQAPLPIGSVNSNIGHLEPASGLAGAFKAILAMEHRVLPRSLHLDEPNSLIDFAALNIEAAVEPVQLASVGTILHCGVSSFGFGGTNAHVVMREPEKSELPTADKDKSVPEFLVLSAQSKEALAETAGRYADLLDDGRVAPAKIAAAAAHRRERLPLRLAIPVGDAPGMAEQLRCFADAKDSKGVVSGAAPSTPPVIAFAFGGNGSQWAGMGRAAYARNASFRKHMQKIDAIFKPLAGWSLVEAINDPALSERLPKTSVAQPLLFAIQSSIAAALAEYGIVPSMVFGHSVGEVAAAERAGALSLKDAVKLIVNRSEQQEYVRGKGKMAATNAGVADARKFLSDIGLTDIEIAAENSANSVTLSGPEASIQEAAKAARKRRMAIRVLDLDYPFHNSALDPVREPLLKALSGISPRDCAIDFISSVTGEVLPGSKLGAEYWWHNVREPVQFRTAIDIATQNGATLFFEIGSKPILRTNINDTMREAGIRGDYIATLDEKDPDAGDPIAAIIGRALVRGVALDEEKLFGRAPVGRLGLPSYPWQHKTYNLVETNEALDLYAGAPRHPLIGARLSQGSPEWRTLLDVDTVPYLADHKVDGEVVVPGAGLAEMLLAVARQTFPEGPIGIEDFDILAPLLLVREQMREMSIRLHDDTNVVEVWSRPRLAGDEWSLHARGRIVQVVGKGEEVPCPEGRPFDGATAEDVYARASETGMDYGPSFRRVRGMRYNDKVIYTDFAQTEMPTGLFKAAQILSPVGLDATFHPLFQTMTVKKGVKRTYLPVRFAKLRVYRDTAEISRAFLLLEHSTDESISTTIVMYSPDDEIVAVLNGGLFRSVVLTRSTTDQLYFNIERTRLERLDRVFDGRSVARKALAALAPAERPDGWLLLEAFARSLAHDVVVNTIGTGPTTIESAIETDKVAVAMAPMASALLNCLASTGLASDEAGQWKVEAKSGLPDPATILATFAAEYPGSSVELVLAAKVLSHLEKAVATGEAPGYRQQLIEQFEASTLLFEPLLSRCAAIVEATEAAMKPDPVNVVVLEPGCLGLVRMLRPYVYDRRIMLTVASSDRKRLDHLAARIGPESGIEFLELGSETPAGPVFNLALATTSDPLFAAEPVFGSAVSSRLAPNAAIVVLQPPVDPLFDVLLGLTEGWFARTLDPNFPVGRIPGIEDTRRTLVSSGYRDIQTVEAGDSSGTIMIAAPAPLADAAVVSEHPPLLIAANGTAADNVFLGQLIQKARASGRSVRTSLAPVGEENRQQVWRASLGAETRGKRIDIADVTGVEHDGDDQARLERRIAEITAILEAGRGCGNQVGLWIVVRGLVGAAKGLDPVAEAVWSFARVAMNEYPDIEIRLVDLSIDLPMGAAAERLAKLIDTPAAEAELLIDASGLSAHRVGRGKALETDKSKLAQAAVLELPHKGALSQFVWSATDRIAPGPNEVEVEVAAAGLNFRDVMMSMGLLDDDVLDAGLAGAVLGFECSGRVVRVGEKVRDLQPGSRVMGFAARAFATHVTADRRVFVPVPERLQLEAAATVPVAFLTAWYSLLEVARLKRGEWVLIHGAAGGVGLAAMQIARWKGAKIVATVGSPDKRALVDLFGADKIFDSRSLSFADDIRREIGGVDVVLNSLYGEAMLASVKCMKPFGRFIELGKRDYVENTFMGLRPFRRNLSYFGVDIDQLLAADPDTADRLMRELERAFEDGNLTPLPYRVFESEDVPSAFRLMQSAGHVGKIVIAPPRRPVPATNGQARFKPKSGVHLVIGGTQGFGFETAAWLAEQGAQNIIVASRRGALSGAFEMRAAAIRATGARFEVEKVDVTDATSVDQLINRILSRYGRLAGVIHTAMVLEDRLMSGIDAEMVRKVLSPKVTGAMQVDRATRHLKLDYFVMYSSATTLVGSPGQSVYVAANGYLQGLARKRRAEGMPALAVAWGAISDAGVLARDAETAKKLARATGVVGIAARDALDQLGLMLASPNGDATQYFADIHAGGAMRDLKLLSTPSFARVFRARGEAEAVEGVDILKLIEGVSEIEAKVKVAELLAVEVGRILRLSSEELDIHRPLSELGMDSLMGLELRMDIEKRFGVELPLIAITSVTNLTDLAGRMIATLRPSGEGERPAADGAISQDLAEKHSTSDVNRDDFAAVAEAIGEQRRSVTRLQ